MLSCIIAGVGGQGTVLLSRLIGMAAMEAGQNVRGSETIGMAQRGGSVVSHVRMGDKIASPLIPNAGADLIIAFEPGEAVRALPFIRDGGTVVVCDRAVMPVSVGAGAYDGGAMMNYLRENVCNLTVADGEHIIKRCGGKAINVALFGIAVGLGIFPFGMEEALTVLKKRIPERYLDMNINALRYGGLIAENKEGKNHGND